VVESNIHKPFDSVQLFDAVRVIARLLTKARDDFGIKIVFTDHRRRAKKRMIGIQYAKGEKQRTLLYKDLLKVTRKTIGYAIQAEKILARHCSADPLLLGLFSEIKHYGDLARKVYDQTYRRSFKAKASRPARRCFPFSKTIRTSLSRTAETHITVIKSV
jgi:IS5 family transposase